MNYLYGWNPVAEFILDEFEELGIPVKGVVIDDRYIDDTAYPKDVNVIASSNVSFNYGDEVINCLGYKELGQRLILGERLLSLGVLRSFVSKKANVHFSSSIGVGTILLGEVVIERRCDIGRHCLFWGGSRVCHDSVLGHGVFIASGSIIGGACTVGDMCTLGFNSSMREKSNMPNRTKVGANRFWRPN